MKRTIMIVLTTILLAGGLAVGAFATGEGSVAVCPDGGEWTKVDSGDLSQYPVDGATEYCFKAGPFTTDTIPEGGFGQEGACEIPNIERCDLSHWSYRIPEQQVDPPFVRITYICKAEQTGTVEEYLGGGHGFKTVSVEAGDHIWRIRHEDGPAADFSTNFLSDVAGSIGVGEALFFVTPQHANGVNVSTDPGPNQYGGTASVSGKICDVEVEEQPEPKVRLTSMCVIDEGVGKMRFREENGVGPIDWEARTAGGSVFASGQIGAGETTFFEAPHPATIIVDWTGPNETSGSTVKAQNNKPCEEEPPPVPGNKIEVNASCDGWTAIAFETEDGQVVGEGEIIARGKWKKKYSREEAQFTFEEETYTVKEPRECVQCRPEIWVWLLFGPDGDTCSIRDWGYDGSYDAPSVESQQACCGWTAENSWGGWVDDCNGWYDSDAHNLDEYYTYERFDVETLLELPCGTNCGASFE